MLLASENACFELQAENGEGCSRKNPTRRLHFISYITGWADILLRSPALPSLCQLPEIQERMTGKFQNASPRCRPCHFRRLKTGLVVIASALDAVQQLILTLISDRIRRIILELRTSRGKGVLRYHKCSGSKLTLDWEQDPNKIRFSNGSELCRDEKHEEYNITASSCWQSIRNLKGVIFGSFLTFSQSVACKLSSY